jgi:iron complex outermembrane receptor protein
MRGCQLLASAGIVLAGVMVAVPTYAQTTDAATSEPSESAEPSPDPAASESSGADIVVTAQRRSQRLQSVPISVSALGGDQLTEKRIQTANDLVGAIPNLRSQNVIGSNSPIFALRGVSMSDYSVNQQGPIASYFDEVYKGSFALLGLGTYDLERVEVLRGPQGTLYGKNTTGGAINFISRKPELGELGGNLSVGYGNYNRHEASGALNVPLGDTAASRTAFTFARADGWFENVFPGKPDANAVREYAIRQSLLFRPSDKLEFVLRAQTSLQNPINYAALNESTADGIGAGAYEAFGAGTSYFRNGLSRRKVDSDFVGRFRRRTAGVGLTTSYELTDALSVVSITAYDYGKITIPEDPDGSPRQVFYDVTGGSTRQFSEDLRLASDFSSGPNFIAGVYYNHETTKGRNEYRYYTDLDVTGDGSIDAADCTETLFFACIYRNSYRQKRKSAAIYTDVNWPVTEQIVLHGGLRYTRDIGRLQDYKAQVLGVDGTIIGNTVPGDPNDIDATTGLSFRTGAVTGKAGIDFKFDENRLFYVSYSRGYRANSFNSQAFFAPSELGVTKPETLDAYEIGLKTQFLDRRLTVNLAGFYYGYNNQQALSINPNNTQQVVNIDKSRIYGGEVEVDFRPVEAVHLFVNAGFLNSKIKRGTVSGVDLRGFQLPAAPKVNLNAGADIALFDNGSSKLTVSGDVSYISKQYFDLLNKESLVQKKYAVVNGRLSYAFQDDRYSIAVWGKNLLNRYYYTAGVDGTAFGFIAHYLGEPRTYGITLAAKY